MEYLGRYHSIVSNVIFKYGGTIHKTMGDGHLISFGLCDEMPDISDVPVSENERSEAEKRRHLHLIRNIFLAFSEITSEFERMTEALDASFAFKIGAALDYGEIELRVIGDQHRKELDIFGTIVNRCYRLDTFGKSIKTEAATTSLLIVSPVAADFVADKYPLTRYDLRDESVRDFPDIRDLFIGQFGRKIEDNQNVSLLARRRGA